jgi:hypothetical protein
VCDGAWGSIPARVGERLRRAVDLEDWSAFRRSFDAFVELLRSIGSGTGPCDGSEPPATVTVLSGDIHFSYRATLTFPEQDGVRSRVNQVVSSPIRNALARNQRAALRFGSSRAGKWISDVLRRSVKIEPAPVKWEIVEGPLFGNCMAELLMLGDRCELTVESARPDEHGEPYLDACIRVDL